MKKKLFSAVLVASMAVGLAACSGSSDSASDTSAAAATSAEATSASSVEETSASSSETAAAPTTPDDVLKVRVGAQATSGHVFTYLADEKGYLADEGVEVEMVYLSNLSDAASALNANQVDVLSTYGTGGPLVNIAQGQDWTIFGGYMIIGETPCYGKPETEFKDLNSFKGKKIGITRGGTPDVVMKGILYDAGFKIGTLADGADVEFVEYKKNPDVLQAIANGEVDFGNTATGYQVQAASLGLEVKMWPDEYWENHSCCRMFATTDYVNNNKEALTRLMRAYIRAEADMQTDEEKQHVADLLVDILDLQPEVTESFVLSPHMKYDTDPYKVAVVTMWNKIFDMGYAGIDPSLRDKVNIEDHINTEIYKDAIEGLVKDYPDNEFFAKKLEQFNKNNQ
jgi:NitT/TauT family transport system substrate-binding protein